MTHCEYFHVQTILFTLSTMLAANASVKCSDHSLPSTHQGRSIITPNFSEVKVGGIYSTALGSAFPGTVAVSRLDKCESMPAYDILITLLCSTPWGKVSQKHCQNM